MLNAILMLDVSMENVSVGGVTKEMDFPAKKVWTPF